MVMKKGSNRAAVNQRQHKIMRYWLLGLGPEEISVTVKVAPATVYRDLDAIKRRLAKQVQVTELYSLRKAFAELNEEWREAWMLYHRSPKVEQKSDDDRIIKALLIDRAHRVILARCRLAGFFSPKVLERITMLETAAGRGIRIERIPWDEQLKRGVEELKNNEGLARSEGLLPPDQHS
jgi:hypothetical protein